MQTNSFTQQTKDAAARYMADLIKRSRARYAALPACAKARIVRELEEGAAHAAREVRG